MFNVITEALYRKCLEVAQLYRIMEGSEEETEVDELDFGADGEF